MNKRQSFIDIARAFAIAFIVFGHTITYSIHCDLIYKILCSFHVVLFFIISGYTFSEKNKKFFLFLKERFIRIMSPYFIWAILFLVPYFLFGREVASSTGAKGEFKFLPQFIKIFYGVGYMQGLKQNTALWFLPALFSMEIIYFKIIKIIRKKNSIYKILFLFFIILVSYITNIYIKFVFPLGINTVLVLGVFFYFGYLCKDFDLFNENKLFKPHYILFMLCIGLLAGIVNDKISAVNYRYGNLTLLFISGTFLSIVIIYISYLIYNNKIIEYIGKNTMIILIFHKLPILIFQTKLGILSKLLINSSLIIEIIMSILVTGLSICFCLLILHVLGKLLIIFNCKKLGVVIGIKL